MTFTDDDMQLIGAAWFSAWRRELLKMDPNRAPMPTWDDTPMHARLALIRTLRLVLSFSEPTALRDLRLRHANKPSSDDTSQV